MRTQFLTLSMLILFGCQSTKVISDGQIESNKNLLLMNQIRKIQPGQRVVPNLGKVNNRSIYCESDLFLYSPLYQMPQTGLAFAFDGVDLINVALFNLERKPTQKSEYRVFQAEDVAVAKNHGNQTLMASTNFPIKVTNKHESKVILLRIPLKARVDESSATFDFQNEKGEFFAGHQKMSCTFDALEKTTSKK